MNNRILRISLLVAFVMFLCQNISAQRVALKTNALDWVLMTPNLSLETRLSSRVTFDIGMAANPLSKLPYLSDVKLRNFRVNPELRYWFNRPMARHFMGIALTGGMFNVRFHEHCYKGNIAAAGVTYGYALVLSRHWNVEFSLGVGLGRVWGYDFRYGQSVPRNKNMSRWVPVPIRTGVSFSYIFR